MGAPPNGLIAGEGLPFSTEKLARGLEAGIHSWRPGESRPLTKANCDITSLAIQRCLEERQVPAQLRASFKEPSNRRVWEEMHAVTIADLPNGPLTIDATHGQFLADVLGRVVDIPLAQKLADAGVRCVAFPSDSYQDAITETMTAIFGDEADEDLLETAQSVYGERWNPANLESYAPRSDTVWITDQIMPRMQEVLAMRTE